MPAINRSKPRITAAQFVANRNDEVRDALNKLGRMVLPCVDTSTFYLTDLMHDAMRMAEMADGAELYIYVTECGTHCFTECDNATARHNLMGIRLCAALKVTCTNPKQKYLPRTWRIAHIALPNAA